MLLGSDTQTMSCFSLKYNFRESCSLGYVINVTEFHTFRFNCSSQQIRSLGNLIIFYSQVALLNFLLNLKLHTIQPIAPHPPRPRPRTKLEH
jgi:hypothetical protein